MVGEIKGKVAYTPLRDTWEKEKGLDNQLVKLAEFLSD